MLNAINSFVVTIVYAVLALFRMPGLNSSRIYALLGHPALQTTIERHGRRRAFIVYHLARRRCPAYAKFLHLAGAPTIQSSAKFSTLPETNKQNYVKAYTIEDRCLDGRIPRRGVVIDESSGSSGAPNNWVRGRDERRSVRRLLRHGMSLTYKGQSVFLLNCFALGPWATGMNLSMSLADSLILKSIGPDKAKLDATLGTFGVRYRYVIAGYPPFIKDWLDNCALDLAAYDLHLVVGGEGFSEGLRDRFLEIFRTVHSSYGASDLEINMAAETERSIAIRRLCAADPALCSALFGRDDPPMVFQYNPLDYLVERSHSGELVFTILRRSNIAPKVRYNIRDIGGSISWRRLESELHQRGILPSSVPAGVAFPILFVYGRSDLTVSFYGAKVYPLDIEAVINADPELRAAFRSFRITIGHDAAHNETMTIALERSRAGTPTPEEIALRRTMYEGLKRANQDFREVSRMFGADRLSVQAFDPGEGPFQARDIRVKERYIQT